MKKQTDNQPPAWFFSILAVGGFIACGIYLGILKSEGISLEHVIRSIVFGMFGILMQWGVLGKRKC